MCFKIPYNKKCFCEFEYTLQQRTNHGGVLQLWKIRASSKCGDKIHCMEKRHTTKCGINSPKHIRVHMPQPENTKHTDKTVVKLNSSAAFAMTKMTVIKSSQLNTLTKATLA